MASKEFMNFLSGNKSNKLSNNYTPPKTTLESVTKSINNIKMPTKRLDVPTEQQKIDNSKSKLGLIPSAIGLFDQKAGETAQSFQNSLFDIGGIPSAINSKLFPTKYAADQQLKAESPKASMAGNLIGSILPGVAIEQAGVKLLPSIFTSQLGAKGLSKGTELAARGILGGGGIMGLQGLSEGIERNMGVQGTLKNVGDKTYEGALMGGIAAPALTGAVKGVVGGIKALPKAKDFVIGRNSVDAFNNLPNLQTGNRFKSPQTLEDIKFVNSLDRTPFPTSNPNKFTPPPIAPRELNPLPPRPERFAALFFITSTNSSWLRRMFFCATVMPTMSLLKLAPVLLSSLKVARLGVTTSSSLL
jgi:hypothetical protein